MVLVADGLVTAPKTTCLADPLVVLAAPVAEPRRLPAVPLLTDHVPDRDVESNVDDVVVRPAGALHVPEAASQICAWNDWNVAVVAVVKSNVYVVDALGAELPRVSLREVTWRAWAEFGRRANEHTENIIKRAGSACSDFLLNIFIALECCSGNIS